MKVLLADSLTDAAVRRLIVAGDEVTVDQDLTVDTLPAAIGGQQVLVVRSTTVDAVVLDEADALGLIVRAGAGTNTIDCNRAAELGILVCNVPGRNALAVAELTLGLLISVDRHIASATADLRDGSWNKKAYSRSAGLYGRRIGIVGLGDVGLAVAARANAFGLDAVAIAKPGRSHECLAAAEQSGVTFVEDMNVLLATSDIVSIHVRGCPDTMHMVDASFLAKMRDGAILINTSRGDVVDEAALIEAMDSRGIRAGLDVFANEPGSGTANFTSALARHRSVVGTHHVGASTAQAQHAIADGAVDVIDAYRTGVPFDCVNLDPEPPRAATLSIRHYDRVGVLAAVLAILRAAKINVSTMQNRVFVGKTAAVATIDVGPDPSDTVVGEVLALDDVIGVSVSRS